MLGTFMGFTGSLYCFAKQMNNGEHIVKLEKSLRAILTLELKFDQVGKPDPQDLQRVESIVNCTVCVPVADGEFADDDAEKLETGARAREARLIREAFTTDIRRRCPGHTCRDITDPDGTVRQCCASREEAVDKMVNALMVPLRSRVTVPALNKWGTLQPVVCVLAMLISMHKLNVRAELWIVGKDLDEAPEQDSDNDNVVDNGAQQQQAVDKRKKDRQRHRKLRVWLQELDTLWKLPAWCCICNRVMTLHWVIF